MEGSNTLGEGSGFKCANPHKRSIYRINKDKIMKQISNKCLYNHTDQCESTINWTVILVHLPLMISKVF